MAIYFVTKHRPDEVDGNHDLFVSAAEITDAAYHWANYFKIGGAVLRVYLIHDDMPEGPINWDDLTYFLQVA